MHHSGSLPFAGDARRAFELAESALTTAGFRIVDRGDMSIEAAGPGMNSSRESPLVGASRIQLSIASGGLAMEAELGGIARMARFVQFFPITLVAILAVAFLLFATPEAWQVIAVVVIVNIAIWLVLGPLMARSMRLRTCRGLDALLANMVAASRATGRVDEMARQDAIK